MKCIMSFYWYIHWFWITCLITHVTSTPITFSSLETISTSLKSALVQNDNSFQQTGNQQKIVSGSKSVPLPFETSDSDDVFGGNSENDAEQAKKNGDWLMKPGDNKNDSEKIEKPKFVSIKLEKNDNVQSDVAALLKNPNVNNTNLLSVATTVLTSVTEANNFASSLKTSTTQTTKLIRINETDEHILNVQTLAESNQNDLNDTVEIIMSNESNMTEIEEAKERKSKGLMGFSEEARVVNNISSRSNFQVTHLSQSTTSDEKSEALFDTADNDNDDDDNNGGITINAGIISVICVGIISSLSAFSIMFVYLYRRRYLNKPQALSEPDSSGYIDDSTIRDNSDELYSLDNDSFLNSLEAMTIQNYWSDVKHTKL